MVERPSVALGEPLLRVEAPLPVAQLVETYVLNQMHLQTMLASKAARVVEAAAGIRQIIDQRMADLIRRVTLERGYDPQDFVLYAYGGADLSPGREIQGPAVLEYAGTTVLIEPGQRAAVDPYLNVRIEP